MSCVLSFVRSVFICVHYLFILLFIYVHVFCLFVCFFRLFFLSVFGPFSFFLRPSLLFWAVFLLTGSPFPFSFFPFPHSSLARARRSGYQPLWRAAGRRRRGQRGAPVLRSVWRRAGAGLQTSRSFLLTAPDGRIPAGGQRIHCLEPGGQRTTGRIPTTYEILLIAATQGILQENSCKRMKMMLPLEKHPFLPAHH